MKAKPEMRPTFDGRAYARGALVWVAVASLSLLLSIDASPALFPLAIGIAVFSLLACVFSVGCAIADRSRCRRTCARRERLSQHHCSDCGRRFGEDLVHVDFAPATEREGDRPGHCAGIAALAPEAREEWAKHVAATFDSDAIIICPHCGLLNVYDSGGSALYPKGDMVVERKPQREVMEKLFEAAEPASS